MMKRRALKRIVTSVFKNFTSLNVDCIINIIVDLVLKGEPGQSKYAMQRRAIEVGRCVRCFRCKEGFYFTTRCNGVTCVPGLSYNEKLATYIREGRRITKPPECSKAKRNHK
ncbi:putative nucleic acid binding protein [Allium carlavirus A]|nr:putative nucleic acid binding protein [Allium carlavirus A]